MLQHLLAQEGVDESRVKRLEAKGIRTMKRMFQKSDWELAHIMDIGVEEMQDILCRLASKDSPAPISVMDMFVKSVSTPSSLRTDIPQLDNALCGGIPTGSVLEVASVAGIGKSQFCLMIAVLCALENPECTILFFDSGGNFNAKRFIEIAHERLSPRQYPTGTLRQSKIEALTKQIHVVHVENLDRIQTKIHELQALMPTMKTKMIIVDSIATLSANSSTDMSVAQRQVLLMSIASDLKLIASAYDAYVVTTNHSSNRKDEMGLYSQPALGLAWSHCITTRIVFEKARNGLVMTIHKAAGASHLSLGYSIEKGGLRQTMENEQVILFDDFEWDDTMLEAIEDTVDELRMHPIEHASQREIETSLSASKSNIEVETITSHVKTSTSDDILQAVQVPSSPESANQSRKGSDKADPPVFILDDSEEESDIEEVHPITLNEREMAIRMVDDIVPESEEDD